TSIPTNSATAPGGIQLPLLGQAKQSAGETPGKILQDDLLDLIARPAQPVAEQFDELHCEHRLLLDEWQEFTAIDDQDLAIGARSCVCGSFPAVEHGDFAEDLTRADQIQDRIASIRGRHADFDGAADHGIQARSGITFRENGRATLERGWLGVAAELVERVGLEFAKDRMLSKDRQLAASG